MVAVGEVFASVLDRAGEVLWGFPMLLLFLLCGAYFTLRSRCFVIRRLKFWVGETFGTLWKSESHARTKQQAARDPHSISQKQALSAALAACLGTGNIVGVGTALLLGGPGALFWMWVSAALGMTTCCVENLLGQKYRWRTASGQWMGGPMAYLEKGLHCKTLARIYAGLLALSGLGMGNMTQANAIADAAKQSLQLPTWATGVVVAVLVGLVIFGGVQRVARLTERLVPMMTGLFLVACLSVILLNLDQLPGVLAAIVRGAFGVKPLAGGLAGYGLKAAMRHGIARGTFSNEAGLGTSAVVHAAAESTSPTSQGLWGMAEVFIDTLLMCTVTGLAFLCSGVVRPDAPEGVALAGQVFASVFGAVGEHFISLSIALFAFATLAGWAVYGEQGVRYLLGEGWVMGYRVLWLCGILLGCTMNLRVVWQTADVLNALLAIPNLIGLAVLGSGAIQNL